MLGYSPIPMDLVERNKQYAAKWMNNFLPTLNLYSFPESVIELDGQPMIDFVGFISGKSGLSLGDRAYKKADRINSILKQYDDLIRMLKGEGALLNHIRPYHLLNFNDLNFTLKGLSHEEIDHIHPSVLRITNERFNYISSEAWCTLFYQVVRIYALSRVNIKSFRNVPGMPVEKHAVPECVSNIYSREEGVLLRWLEVHYEQQFGITSRLLTWDKGLRDGWHLAAVIQAYVGTNKYFTGMKKNCVTEDDFITNA